jgi:hypothetical protein
MQHDVVGPVTWAFPDEVFVAHLDRLQRRDTIAPIGKVNKRGRPSEKRSAPNLLGAGRNERRAVGFDPHVMEVHVRIDAAGHDDMPRRIDQLGGLGRQRSGSGDRGNRFAGDRDVTANDALGRHHIAVANNEIEHLASWRRQGGTLGEHRLRSTRSSYVRTRNKPAGF